MTTTPNESTLTIVARPIDDERERPFVWGTVNNAMCSLHGGPWMCDAAEDERRAPGRYADRTQIASLVSSVMLASKTKVATFRQDSEILGFVSIGEVGAVEFLYLRQSIIPRRGWDENVWGFGLRTWRLFGETSTQAAIADSCPFTDAEMRISDLVCRALLGDRMRFVARRPIHPRVLEAVTHAGYEPVVSPGAI